MSALIPNGFLIDVEFPIRYRANSPKLDGRLSGWTDDELLPKFGALDKCPEYADVWACWNDSGLFLAFSVTGKRRPTKCNPRAFRQGDNIQVFTDMRDARTNRRATRFCQRFYFLPSGGSRSNDAAVAGTVPIQQAREFPQQVSADRLTVASAIDQHGYSLEAQIPPDCLSGWNPREHPRIGLFYLIENADLGSQFLVGGAELNPHVDPSVWATAVLELPR